MTSPIGYPDWQHISTSANQPLLEIPNQSAPVATLTAVVPCGNYDELFIRADPSGTSTYVVKVIWLNTNPGGSVIHTQSYVIAAPSNGMFVTLPVLQPFVQLEFIPISFTPGDIIFVTLAPVTRPTTLSDLNGPMVGELIRQNIAGGTTNDLVGNRIAPGAARWFFGLDGQSGVFTVLVMNTAGAFVREYTIGPINGPSFQTLSIVLPAAPIKLETQNTGAGAANFWNVLGTER